MDALVSEVAVPVSPLPMPVVVKSLSGNRQDRCRARPQVIVATAILSKRVLDLVDLSITLVC